MRYIDADRLKAEIESRMGDCDANSKNPNQLLWAELAALIPFVNSLQQEQPSEDLDADITAYLNTRYSDRFKDSKIVDFTTTEAFELAHHFAEWQKAQMGEQARKELAKTDITLADLVAFDEGLKLGRRLERQDMLKDAVEGKVVKLADTYDDLTISVEGKELNEALQPLGVKDGDKVKIIIVKEDKL